jgi:16S rRNA (guanine966-N2)-methyltransferase
MPLRIVAGQWRGRTLQAPPGATTRPTADRARQALFDMLRHAPWADGLDGVTVLDAFAGTGALGLEALSRGAAFVHFIEQDRTALAALRANIAACQAGASSRVIAGDATNPPPGAPCGLVLLDPPYGQNSVPRALMALQAQGWIAPAALIVAELGRNEAAPWVNTPLDIRTHGAAQLVIWRATKSTIET